jgi:hypothetical protein
MILANACTNFVNSPASVGVRSPCLFLDVFAGPDVVLEAACASHEANTRDPVKALFRKGNSAARGQPARTAQIRQNGG